VARDVIPRELRRAGAGVEVIEAYETAIPTSSRARLRSAMKDPLRRPHVITFTSSSSVRNFVALGGKELLIGATKLASIGPVTSSTLRAMGFGVDIEAAEYTIPGLTQAIVDLVGSQPKHS
jgi:uroporphyrinogen-III synthase